MLRLTLRTLLSYLDDTLDPAQAKVIGQKVADSEQARELIERIRQVTRRRRLMTPPTSGPGGLDPNTMADYLDNEVTPDQAAEVEQVCLASDVHLAEVAACHQILTLVLGEPALVPPSAKQRMYGLVKGPEAIPFRKPPRPEARPDLDLSSEINADHDETLRLGVPAFGGAGGWRNPLLLIGGGVIAGCLLVVALVQLLHTAPGPHDSPDPDQPLAKVDTPDREKEQPKPAPIEANPKPKPEEKKPVEVKEKGKGNEDLPFPKDEPPAPKQETAIFPDVPLADPDPRIVPVGRYIAPPPKQPNVLAQLIPDKGVWQRFDGDKVAEVASSRPVLSIPGSRTVIDLNKGVQLTLWGMEPELNGGAPLYESLVKIFPADKLHADLNLLRGRILLTNQNAQPAFVRVRFEDPKRNKQEAFDITLLDKDATLLVERWTVYPLSEPFYENPKHPNRVGPTVQLNVAALAGTSSVRIGGPTFTLSPPPAAFMLTWNSLTGVSDAKPNATLPDAFLDKPPVPKGGEKIYAEALQAYNTLARNAQSKALDVVLAETIKASDPALRRLAVRSYAAMDEIGLLLDRLQDENASPDVRDDCIDALQYWLSMNRDNDYSLLGKLRGRYKESAAQKIVELLHYIPTNRLGDPVTYETLIDDLDNPVLPIRQLSAWHLYSIVKTPDNRGIPYSPTDPAPRRIEARNAWFKLIPRGQLPKAAQPKGK